MKQSTRAADIPAPTVRIIRRAIERRVSGIAKRIELGEPPIGILYGELRSSRQKIRERATSLYKLPSAKTS
jgi:hypothetical protein